MSPRVTVFTWNLHKNRGALRLACKYLARRAPCVASFQELPSDAGPEDVSRYGRGMLREVARVGRGLAIVASADVATTNITVHRPRGTPTADQRMIEVTLTSTPFEGLRFVAVHFPGRRDLPERQRDGSLTRLADAFHDAWRGDPVILAGDFNADPYDREIAARGYFWAVRDRGELTNTRAQLLMTDPDLPVLQDGELYQAAGELRALMPDRSPLYNPMWRCLPERSGHPRGTHHYLDDHCGISWHCYDQVLLSPDLVEYIHQLRILSKLGKTKLIEDDQTSPPDRGYSDHLPVKLVLSIGEVADGN